jgi:hypothetical protein
MIYHPCPNMTESLNLAGTEGVSFYTLVLNLAVPLDMTKTEGVLSLTLFSIS